MQCFTQYRGWFLLLAMGAVAAGCGGEPSKRVVARPSPGADQPSGTVAAPAPTSVATAGLLVDVAGQVRRPGVYRMRIGARVHEAIAAAGGATGRADLATLNRAATLVDGQQVLLAERASPGAHTGPGATQAPQGTVSINSADEAALDALPGIGPVTAARIVAERESSGPFASIDDLNRVSGVGPATIEALRDAATT